jgi:hypothetical protein
MINMKLKFMNIAGVIVLSAALLTASCDKETIERVAPEMTDFSATSQLQFFNGIVGSNRTYVYVNFIPVNGAIVSYGSSFPSSAIAAAATSGLTPYNFILSPGTNAFNIRDTATVTTQLPLTFSENLQANTYYTIFGYDTATSPKKLTVVTTIQHPTDGTARLRFGNLAYSPTTVDAVDVFSIKAKTTLFSNIPTPAVTDFKPYTPVPNDTLLVFRTGTTDTLARFNAFNAVAARSYTMIYRGSYLSTTTATGKAVTIFANY